MNALIVEDEARAVVRLKEQLSNSRETIDVVGVCESVGSTLHWLANNQEPDLLFLDIQLSDGHSFDILNEITISSPIIFTTAFDEYAVRAFKQHSIAYLLKPFQQEDVDAALEKLRRMRNDQKNTRAISELIAAHKSELRTTYKTRFFVKSRAEAHSMASDDIVLFNHEEGSVLLYTPGKDRYHVNYSLDQLQTLIDPEKFFRISRNQIVSIDHIIKIDISIKGKLYVLCDCVRFREPISVSKHRVHEFRVWLGA